MNEAITCKCGSREWIISELGTMCAKCMYLLDAGCVVANIAEINKHLKIAKENQT